VTDTASPPSPPFDPQRARAARWGLQYHDLAESPPIGDAVRRVPLELMVRERWIPIDVVGDTAVIASVHLPQNSIRAQVREALDVTDVEWRLTGYSGIDQSLQDAFRTELLDNSILGLYRINPESCAYTVFTRSQYLVMSVMLVTLVAFIAAFPSTALFAAIILINLCFSAGIVFKFAVAMVGARSEQRQVVTDAEVAELLDEDLPMYTVLVPAYKEANVVTLLFENLRSLDYPADKLDIILLLESDDHETIDAARGSIAPEAATIMLIPDAPPKTKPKACNVGLQFARGDYVVIYDAEDRPESDQLKRALIAFRKGGEDMVCVQAALNYFNRNENFLTRMFTLEYSFWFDYVLPGLDRLRLPIPLGGTSNHFRTGALKELGGWDPFNVTEDADLGIRAAAQGYRVGVVNSTTFEEANNDSWNWIRQRSRWIKGYIQTVLVHLRHPVELVRQTGLRQAFGFMILIGGTPATFLAMPLAFITSLWVLLWGRDATGDYPPFLLAAMSFNFLVGNGLMIYLNLLAVYKRQYYQLVPFALLNPLYWCFHAFASYKAAIQLVTKPFYWEKTTHGLTSHPTRDHLEDHENADSAA
jgi:cellulose synthase/poly-beta-1,6-N-acetylglucosamine synthase-like glycosyltransferase